MRWNSEAIKIDFVNAQLFRARKCYLCLYYDGIVILVWSILQVPNRSGMFFALIRRLQDTNTFYE